MAIYADWMDYLKIIFISYQIATPRTVIGRHEAICIRSYP